MKSLLLLALLCVVRGMEPDDHAHPLQLKAAVKQGARAPVAPKAAPFEKVTPRQAGRQTNVRDGLPIGKGGGLQLPACWMETWGKYVLKLPVIKRDVFHHTAVAYMRRNEQGLINVQFYCNHGTCPGFQPRADHPDEEPLKMDLVHSMKWDNVADCPRYLLTCDMLRTKKWTAEKPEYFTYLKQGHVCNTDSLLERFTFEHKIRDVNALNNNPDLLKQAYEICSETKCEIPQPAMAAPIFPDIYNIWKQPDYAAGVHFTEPDDALHEDVYKAYMYWQPAHGPPDGVYYASLTPMDENDTMRGMLKVVLKNSRPARRAIGTFMAIPGPGWIEKFKGIKEQGTVSSKSHYVEGVSRAEFRIPQGNVAWQPKASEPMWLDDPSKWYSYDSFQ